MVLAAEGFNTAIERLVDLVSPDFHPIAGDVKDVAAGAVLICAIAAAIVGAIIFILYPELLIKLIIRKYNTFLLYICNDFKRRRL